MEISCLQLSIIIDCWEGIFPNNYFPNFANAEHQFQPNYLYIYLNKSMSKIISLVETVLIQSSCHNWDFFSPHHFRTSTFLKPTISGTYFLFVCVCWLFKFVLGKEQTLEETRVYSVFPCAMEVRSPGTIFAGHLPPGSKMLLTFC